MNEILGIIIIALLLVLSPYLGGVLVWVFKRKSKTLKEIMTNGYGLAHGIVGLVIIIGIIILLRWVGLIPTSWP